MSERTTILQEVSILRSRWAPTDTARVNLHGKRNRSLQIQQEGGVGTALITIELYIDGVLQSTALAPNTATRGKPQHVVFANSNLHSSYLTRIWHCAHIAVLDEVSTIGRRFVRRSPASLATFNQMTGAIDALKDNDVSTRIASNLAGQRVSFTLMGPTGLVANCAIAAVHLKQLTQGGKAGPTNTAGFLRIGSANFDAAARPVPTIAPKPIYSTWGQNPATAAL